MPWELTMGNIIKAGWSNYEVRSMIDELRSVN